MRYYVLLLLFIFSLLSRFYLLNTVPPLFDAQIQILRLSSAVLNILSIFLLYIYVKKTLNNTKIALLSAWVMATLPWVLEQGRIYSYASNSLFFLLLFLLFWISLNNLLARFILLISFFITLYFSYPNLWIFKTMPVLDHPIIFINNLFNLLSPDNLFFRNFTFWWGGVKEVGVMYILLFPFLIFGLLEIINHRRYKLLYPCLFILFLSVVSPSFPESREFYFITPFLALTVAFGIYKLFLKGIQPLFILIFTALITYEIIQFFHYYYIHYPQDIISNKSNIKDPF